MTYWYVFLLSYLLSLEKEIVAIKFYELLWLLHSNPERL